MIQYCFYIVLAAFSLRALETYECRSMHRSEGVSLACDNLLHDQYRDLITTVNTNREKELIARARDLSTFLKDQMNKRGDKFACEDAKSILSQSAAKSFLDDLSQYVAGKKPQMSLYKMTEVLNNLQDDFESLPRKQQGLTEVARVADPVKQIGRLSTKVHAAHKAVASANDCVGDFKNLISELDALAETPIPTWHSLASFVARQTQICSVGYEDWSSWFLSLVSLA